ncbi:MAG: thioesterase, FlK family [Rhodococcus sp. (in: high G+C Gram-positive bacteria)]
MRHESQLDCRAHTLVGETVTIEAELTEQTGRVLVVAVEARDGRGPR